MFLGSSLGSKPNLPDAELNGASEKPGMRPIGPLWRIDVGTKPSKNAPILNKTSKNRGFPSWKNSQQFQIRNFHRLPRSSTPDTRFFARKIEL